MTTPTPNVLSDKDLDGLSDVDKENLVDGRISGLRQALAGVLLDSATNQYSVDVPEDQRTARQELLAKQEQALRGTLTALREIKSTIG